MIHLMHVWLPQIICYAELIQDGTLEKAWLGEVKKGTSVYYSGELYEQIFGDLDADNKLMEARLMLKQQPKVVNALDDFLNSLKRLDEWIEAHVDTAEWGRGNTTPSTVRNIFQTQEWRDAQASAAAVVMVSGQAGFTSKIIDSSD